MSNDEFLSKGVEQTEEQVNQILHYMLYYEEKQVLGELSLEDFAKIIQYYGLNSYELQKKMYNVIIENLTDKETAKNKELKLRARILTQNSKIAESIEQKSYAKKCANIASLSSKINKSDKEILSSVLYQTFGNPYITVAPEKETAIICQAVKELKEMHNFKDDQVFQKCLDKINKYLLHANDVNFSESHKRAIKEINQKIQKLNAMLNNYETILKDGDLKSVENSICNNNTQVCTNKLKLLHSLYTQIKKLSSECGSQLDKIIKEGKYAALEGREDVGWFDKAKIEAGGFFGF